MSAPAPPPAAVTIGYKVGDFETWRRVFDSNRQGRIDHGFVAHHINRAEDDPNDITIFLAAGDADSARAYLASDELKELMRSAGVLGPPQRAWMKPLRQAIDWDRELPAAIISHHVADVPAWLDGYDQADEVRRSAGIVGHAANQSLDDPSLVVVYHQAESFDELRALLASEELQAAMRQAGVTSEPEVRFHTGGHGERY